MKNLCAFVLAVAALSAACGPKTGAAPAPLTPEAATAAAARRPGSTPTSIAAGHDTFIANCNRCHGYPLLSAIAEEKWPSILDEMAEKAKLTPEAKRQVLDFVLAARADGAKP